MVQHFLLLFYIQIEPSRFYKRLSRRLIYSLTDIPDRLASHARRSEVVLCVVGLTSRLDLPPDVTSTSPTLYASP